MAISTKQDQSALNDAQTDRVAAAKARAASFLSEQKEQMGTVLGLSADHLPYWFVPAEVGDGTAAAIRRDLLARGFDHAPQASVSGVGTAEVWECHPEVAAALVGARKKRDRLAWQEAHRGAE